MACELTVVWRVLHRTYTHHGPHMSLSLCAHPRFWIEHLRSQKLKAADFAAPTGHAPRSSSSDRLVWRCHHFFFDAVVVDADPLFAASEYWFAFAKVPRPALLVVVRSH